MILVDFCCWVFILMYACCRSYETVLKIIEIQNNFPLVKQQRWTYEESMREFSLKKSQKKKLKNLKVFLFHYVFDINWNLLRKCNYIFKFFLFKNSIHVHTNVLHPPNSHNVNLPLFEWRRVRERYIQISVNVCWSSSVISFKILQESAISAIGVPSQYIWIKASRPFDVCRAFPTRTTRKWIQKKNVYKACTVWSAL